MSFGTSRLAPKGEAMRIVAAIMVAIALTASPVLAQAPPPKSYSFLDTVRESLFGDVFYRLAVGGGSFAHNFNDNGNQYSGAFTVYAPFSARFEVRLDVPFIVS